MNWQLINDGNKVKVTQKLPLTETPYHLYYDQIIHIRQAKVRASAKGFTGKQVHIGPKTSRPALGHSTGTPNVFFSR